MSKIIAFGYKKRTGKDTAAKFLNTILRLNGKSSKRVSFADKLKDISYQLFSWADLQPGLFYEQNGGIDLKEKVLPKINKSPRQIWIEIGNKMREVYGSIWIKNALCDINHDIIIIKDLRYINEAQQIIDLGGILVKIDRINLPLGTDQAEIDLDNWLDWDHIITNEGTLEAFHKKIEVLANDTILR